MKRQNAEAGKYMTNNTETYNIYQNRLNKLLNKLESLEVWKEKNAMIKYIFEQAKWLQQNDIDNQSPEILLRAGGRLVGCYTYLEAKAGEKQVVAKLSEMAYKEVRDSLMVSIKDEKITVTEAKARAQSETQETETDVYLKQLEAERYKAATRGAMNMATMIQSALRVKGYEKTSTKLQ